MHQPTRWPPWKRPGSRCDLSRVAPAKMLGQPAQSLRSARFAVATVFFIHGVVFASWTAHVPHVKESLGLTEASLGIGLLGAPVGSVAATVLGGALLTRAGSRIVV